jgi:hypothetical protein
MRELIVQEFKLLLLIVIVLFFLSCKELPEQGKARTETSGSENHIESFGFDPATKPTPRNTPVVPFDNQRTLDLTRYSD